MITSAFFVALLRDEELGSEEDELTDEEEEVEEEEQEKDEENQLCELKVKTNDSECENDSEDNHEEDDNEVSNEAIEGRRNPNDSFAKLNKDDGTKKQKLLDKYKPLPGKEP